MTIGTKKKNSPCFDSKDYRLFKHAITNGIKYIDHPCLSEDLTDPTAGLSPLVTWAMVFTSDIDEIAERTEKYVALTDEQEFGIFMLYNKRRKMAADLVAQWPCDNEADSIALMMKIVDAIKLAHEVRDRIICFNIGLVASSATSFLRKFPICRKNDLFSEGCQIMLRIVDNFDASRGNRLSTYSFSALTNIYRRTSLNKSKLSKREKMFSAFEKDDDSDTFRSSIEKNSRQTQGNEAAISEMLRVLEGNEADLNDRERRVIELKHLTPTEHEITWNEVSEILGVSREAARTAYISACEKLKKAMTGDDDEDDQVEVQSRKRATSIED